MSNYLSVVGSRNVPLMIKLMFSCSISLVMLYNRVDISSDIPSVSLLRSKLGSVTFVERHHLQSDTISFNKGAR